VLVGIVGGKANAPLFACRQANKHANTGREVHADGEHARHVIMRMCVCVCVCVCVHAWECGLEPELDGGSRQSG
jgi:hypothetical protein